MLAALLTIAPLLLKLFMAITNKAHNAKIHKLEREKAEALMDAKIARQGAAMERLEREIAVSTTEKKMSIANLTNRKAVRETELAARYTVGEMSREDVRKYLKDQGLLS